LIRGKGLYDGNCASCHAADLRGVPPKGTNLLRAGSIHNDKAGELVGAAVAKHTPALNLVQTDLMAVRDYLQSVLATMGGQGGPPGGRGGPAGVQLNVLVGDAKAGEAYVAKSCTSCHSLAGFFKGIGSRYPDPRTLQNAWVQGGGGGGGGRGGGGGGNPTTVTLANGEKLEGTLVRRDDFLVIIYLPDGTRKSMARTNGIPKVDVVDPNAAHKKMVLELDDPQNKNMYDVTAYLATLK
jgi:cytochrome c oxidase cbb3-type subunit 3